MFQENTCFDPEAENGFSQAESFSMEEQSFPPQNPISHQEEVAAALEMELQHQIMNQENCYTTTINEMQSLDHHQIQEIVQDNSTWQEINHFNGENPYNHHHQAHSHQLLSSIIPETPYPTTPDLLNIFPLPRCSTTSSLFPSSINSSQKSHSLLASLGLLGDLNPTAGDGSSGSTSVLYDPLLPLNLPPQPPLLRELFHSLSHHHGSGYGVGGGNNGSCSLFGGGGVDEMRDLNGGLYQDGDGRQFENGVFEFGGGEMDCLGKNRDGKDTKHFATERHRRVLLNDKYQALRKLIPQPTKKFKNDRASIVQDAIDYINELKRCATEIQVMLEQKRCARERRKRPKAEDEAMEGKDSKSDHVLDNPFNGSPLRSSWLHRKSKNTEVDVRIVDDEVTVKLVQQKRINCLLSVSRVLDELQLDLHHVAGGLIGDYYSFLFNSKICEGSIVYASAIANKLIEVVDKQYAAIPPSNGY